MGQPTGSLFCSLPNNMWPTHSQMGFPDSVVHPAVNGRKVDRSTLPLYTRLTWHPTLFHSIPASRTLLVRHVQGFLCLAVPC